MKKYSLLIIVFIVCLTYFSSGALALERESKEASRSPDKVKTQRKETKPTFERESTKAARLSEKEENKTEDLRERAYQEIDRRIASLNKLLERLGSMKRLSAQSKTALTDSIKVQIESLTGLRKEIEEDTEMVDLKVDVKSIKDSYRIYALYMPQIHILAAADVILGAVANMSEFADKLETQIDLAKTSGKDVLGLENLLLDMRKKIDSAETLANNAIKAATPLTPSGFPGNKTILESSRRNLHKAKQDLEQARKDAQAIKKGLGEPASASAKLLSPSSTSSGRTKF